MPTPTIVILGADRYFSAVVAEQVKQELSVSCHIVAEGEDASAFLEQAALAIAPEQPGKELPCPVVIPRTRPIRLGELLQDIEKTLRRPTQPESLEIGRGYAVRTQQKQLSFNGRSVDVTDKEVQLLQCLAAAEGGISKEQLLKTVWGFESALDTHTLETHIYRLRGKFRELAGEEDDMIMAIEGGYGLRM